MKTEVSLLTGVSNHAMVWGNFANGLKQAEIEAAWERKKRAEIKENSAQFKAAIRRDWLKRHLSLQDHKCHYCKIPIVLDNPGPKQAKATIDHIHSLSRGGPDEFDNTVAACGPCNNIKADGTIEELHVNPKFLKRLEVLKKKPAKSA